MRLVNILGTGRNGSTLLSRLLDGIPEAYIHPREVNFLTALNDMARYGKIRRLTHFNATTEPLGHVDIQINSNVLLSYYSRHYDEIREQYLSDIKEIAKPDENPISILRSRASYTPREFVIMFLKTMAGWIHEGVPISTFFFKSIETAYVEDYERIFPEMKFIHLIRNPIDTCSSQKRTLLKKSRPLGYLGNDYLETMLDKRWLPHAASILSRINSDEHFIVRYEDLTERPVEIIMEICAWLDVQPPPHPDKQTFLGGKFLKKMPPNPSAKGVPTPVGVVLDMKKKFKYEEVLTPGERDFIIARTYDLGRLLGYFQDETPPQSLKVVYKWLVPTRCEFAHGLSPISLPVALYKMFYRRMYILKTLFTAREKER